MQSGGTGWLPGKRRAGFFFFSPEESLVGLLQGHTGLDAYFLILTNISARSIRLSLLVSLIGQLANPKEPVNKEGLGLLSPTSCRFTLNPKQLFSYSVILS